VPPSIGRFIIAWWWLAILIASTTFYVVGLLLIAVDRAYSWAFRLLWIITGILSYNFLPFVPFAYWLRFVERPQLFRVRVAV